LNFSSERLVEQRVFAVVGMAAWNYGGCAAPSVESAQRKTDQSWRYWITQRVERGKENRGRKALRESLRGPAERIPLQEAD
jgi:hypothetical protein